MWGVLSIEMPSPLEPPSTVLDFLSLLLDAHDCFRDRSLIMIASIEKPPVHGKTWICVCINILNQKETRSTLDRYQRRFSSK